MELSNPRIPLVTQFPQVPQGLCPLLQRLHSRSRHELRDWAARRDAAKLPLYRLSQLSCNVAVPPHRAAAITPTGPDTLDMPSTFWKGSPKSVHYISPLKHATRRVDAQVLHRSVSNKEVL